MTALNQYSPLRLLVLLALMPLCAGCGGDPEPEDPYKDVKLFPVTGSVTVNGKAPEGLSLQFHTPRDAKYPGGHARTDASGNFVAKSRGNDGLAAGKYYVLLSWLTTPDGKPIPDGALSSEFDFKNNLPEKFQIPDESPFFIEIVEGENAPVELDVKFR